MNPHFTNNNTNCNINQNTQIKFIQINLNHSRIATNNLMQIIAEEGTEVICIQEPYYLHNKIAGIPRKYKICAAGDGRHRAAIVVTNNQLDIILLRQLSDEDTVVLEVVSGKAKTIVACMYFDITRQIEDDLNKIEAIVDYAKGAGILLAIDSNSRSKTWHDTQTNNRGRILEEFLISVQLHVMNEESSLTTFINSRGSSNIDLTIINNQLLRLALNWEISDQESCSDHSIIKYTIGQDPCSRSHEENHGVRYIVKKEDINSFQRNFYRLLEEMHNLANTEGGLENIPYIVGLGKAVELLDFKTFATMQGRLEEQIVGNIPDVIINGRNSVRLSNTTSISFRAIEGEGLIYALANDNILASTGSACSTGSLSLSHVLQAMNVPIDYAHGTIRISLGLYNKEEDIDYIILKLIENVSRLRDLSPFWQK